MELCGETGYDCTVYITNMFLWSVHSVEQFLYRKAAYSHHLTRSKIVTDMPMFLNLLVSVMTYNAGTAIWD